MSIWLILFLVQVIASVYAFARQPKQDRRRGAYAVRKAE
jgi:tryptophan-rich sensory protein